jgi:hypothetical protein
LEPGTVKRIVENMIPEALMEVTENSIIPWDVVNFYRTTTVSYSRRQYSSNAGRPYFLKYVHLRMNTTHFPYITHENNQ